MITAKEARELTENKTKQLAGETLTEIFESIHNHALTGRSFIYKTISSSLSDKQVIEILDSIRQKGFTVEHILTPNTDDYKISW